MKVALYQPWVFKRGGAERVLLELFKNSQHELTLFTHHFNHKTTFEEFSNYDVRPLSSDLKIKGIITQGINFAKEILKTKINLNEFDVFVISAGAIGGLITIRNHGIPIMAYCQSLLLFDEKVAKNYKDVRYYNFFSKTIFSLSRSIYHIFERKAWSYMSLVIANSIYIKNLIQKAGLANDVFVLNPGVDTETYRPTWNYKKYFLVPGWINQFKRQHLAIEAFKLFSKNNKDFKLVVTGRVLKKDKWYFDKLKEVSEGDENIIIIPNDENLLNIYQNAYAVIVPSLAEAWGLVALEAMACGKPVITTNEGGTSESVIDGKSGFVIPANPVQFAEKMEILASNRGLHREMGVNAYERALQYDWKKFATKFDQYIDVAKDLDRTKDLKIEV